MEYSCLPSIVKMMAYSFESDNATFIKLLDCFKDGCLQIFGKGFDLVMLLDAVTEQSKSLTTMLCIFNLMKLTQYMNDGIRMNVYQQSIN